MAPLVSATAQPTRPLGGAGQRTSIAVPGVVMRPLALFAALLVALPSPAQGPPPRLGTATPESLGLSSRQLDQIDRVVREAIDRKELPGAVVLIAHQGKVVYRKAFGQRSLQPDAV